jgi:hypothetical protein
MAKRILIIGACAMALALAALVLLLLVHEPRQELARAPNADGSVTVIVGQERLFGLLGIEIIHERQDETGRVHSASVKGFSSSWSEARRRYAPPEK